MSNTQPRPLQWLRRIDEKKLAVASSIGRILFATTTDELRTALKFDTYLRTYEGNLNQLHVPLSYHAFAERINSDPAITGGFVTIDILTETFTVPPTPVHRAIFSEFLRPLGSQGESALVHALGLSGVSAHKQRVYGKLLIEQVEKNLDKRPRKPRKGNGKDKQTGKVNKQFLADSPTDVSSSSSQYASHSTSTNTPTTAYLVGPSNPLDSTSGTYDPPSPTLSNLFAGPSHTNPDDYALFNADPAILPTSSNQDSNETPPMDAAI
ncbi:hypothetical protein GGU11DRAFT_761050 [Lentinula aff. detonsa]|nr:hypothetical protein GGU11DRAFT_761050 [Lentinula aff. detonsa]